MEIVVSRRQFWAGKRVLVTGHTGFKGGWLVLWLHALGAHVAGYALAAPSKPALWDHLSTTMDIQSYSDDIRIPERLLSVFEEFQPEIVFHLAAQSLVRSSYIDPIATYSTNVMGTVNVLEAVRQSRGVRVLVNVTSDKCYENREWERGYREDDAMGGYDPYSSSKGCAELVTAAYRNSYFSPRGKVEYRVAVASARAGNVIGGGDWAQDRLVPDVIRAALERKPARIRNPNAVRPWQHVLDPLHGYLILAEHLCDDGANFAGGWNFGPAEEEAVPVRVIADQIAAAWADRVTWEADPGPHPHEAHYLKLDCSRARTLLGWRPTLKLKESVEWSVDWYREYERKADMKAVCLEQIAKFENLAAR